MAFISVNDLIKAASVLGTEKIPVSKTQYIDIDQIVSYAESSALDLHYIKVDGTNSILSQLNFNTEDELVSAILSGELRWSINDGTLLAGLPDGGSLQIGQEIFNYYTNVDTVPLTEGMFVCIKQVGGNRKAIKRLDPSVKADAFSTVGMVTVASIPVNGIGRVTKAGHVTPFDTRGWADNACLYVSHTNIGTPTDIPPPAGYYTVKIGHVVVSTRNGTIDIMPQVFPKLTDLSDVNGTPLTLSGQIPVWDNNLQVFDFTKNIENYYSKTEADLLLGNKVNTSLVGAANGVATLGADGLVPSTQLPSFVDDVLEFANLAAFPVVGETGKIYVALDTNKTYRWSGSTYIYITSGAVDSVAGKTGVVVLVKGDVGLGNVDNTSDANKPISTATQTALNGKVNNTGNETIAGVKTFSSSPLVPDVPATDQSAVNKQFVVGTANSAITKAQQWAENPEDVPVETGQFSALHWAAKAQESAESIEGVNSLVIQNTAEIASIENVINSMNPNQENRVTVTGVDTISLPKTAANTGMQVQVFGQSAENLVVNGDFRNGTTGWLSRNIQDLILSNGVISFKATSTVISTQRHFYRNTTSSGGADKIYGRADVKGSGTILLRWGGVPIASSTAAAVTDFERIGGIFNYNVASGSLREYGITDSATSEWSTIYVKNIMLINLTATFGAGNEPTKEQCDLLFANYFEGTDNVLGTGRVRSVGKNLFDRTNVVLNKTINSSGQEQNSTLANASNFIRVQPSTTYIFSGKAGASFVCFYDLNKTFISSSSVANASVTSPATAYFVRFGVVYAQMDTCQMERGTVATTVSPFIQSSLYIQTPELRSNGLIKDEIRKGTNGYELIKRVGVGTLGANGIAGGDFEGGLIGVKSDADGSVSTWTLNTTNPISGAQDGLFNITTPASTLARPTLNFTLVRSSGEYRRVSFQYKVNSGTCTIALILKGATVDAPNQTLAGSGTFTWYYLCNSSAPLAIYFAPNQVFNAQFDNFKDELINTPDGVPIVTPVTLIGSNIHYTLATPTITPIAHAGLLNSNSNGTTYFEPVVADAGVYSTNIAIQLTDYPIASIERLVKRVAGVDVELSTSTAVIAGDGLSFTHPNLASGDLVMFTYNYNRESIGRSMTLTHYDSRFYPKWDDEYPSGQWVDAAAQAAPTEVNVTIAGVATRKQSFGTGDAKSNMFEIRHGSAIDFINSGEMPLEFHIHAMPSSNNAGTAIFTFNWCYSPPNAAPIAGTPIDVTFTIAANRQYWHLLAGGNLALPVGGFAIGGKIEFTVTRKTAGNTYANAILFDKCALHRAISTMGTINIYSN